MTISFVLCDAHNTKTPMTRKSMPMMNKNGITVLGLYSGLIADKRCWAKLLSLGLFGAITEFFSESFDFVELAVVLCLTSIL